MKEILFKSALAAIVGVGLMAGSSLATPVYTGDTYAAWGEGGLPTLPTETGYYIWSNDAAKSSWSVRWTGSNEGEEVWESWAGSIQFIGNDLETLTAIEWDDHDGSEPVYTNLASIGIEYEAVSYTASAGWHWDGFDFTINEDASAGRLQFNLGGSYYSDLIANDTDAGVAALGMWIGDGNVMNVNIATTTDLNPNYMYQSFETPAPAPVPEPATMLLFGTGLVGLAGVSRRRKSNSGIIVVPRPANLFFIGGLFIARRAGKLSHFCLWYRHHYDRGEDKSDL